MGDYGTKGAGEFGGQDTNFSCLPDFHFTKCPNLEKIAGGCQETGSKCNFAGDDYRKCPGYKA